MQGAGAIPLIQVSQRALTRARELLAREAASPTAGLRLAVEGGGCSGLAYAVRLDGAPVAGDRVFEFEDVRVFIDRRSLIYLAGTVLDYQTGNARQGFVVENPQVGPGCGCGPTIAPTTLSPANQQR